MDNLLAYYTVTAEPDSGFWIGQPVRTGETVRRSEWLRLMEQDPDHFELVTLTPEDLGRYEIASDKVIELAVFVTRSNEQLH